MASSQPVKGRPFTGKRSWELEYRRGQRQAQRILHEYGTSKLNQFGRLMRHLHTSIRPGRITALFNRRHLESRRYVTEDVEMEHLLNHVQGLEGRCEDVCCGMQNIACHLNTAFPDLEMHSWDNDPSVLPDMVCDFLDPSTYHEENRPDFIVMR
jgi:hypothetical protein